MTTEEAPRELRTSPEIGGMGHSVKRKEDPRFIRGAEIGRASCRERV